MKYLNLVRYKNLLLIALMQLVLHFGFLKLQGVPVALNDWYFGLLVLATIFIAAAGYLINDIIDQEIDSVNKPGKNIIGTIISEDRAFNIYIGLNIIGLLNGFYITYYIGKNSFFGIFIIAIVLLYLYATSFKKIAIVGNLTVSFVLGLSVLLVGIFDIIPIIYGENQSQMALYLNIILDYAIFGFFINFIREIVKDMEDILGDDEHGLRTLPIVIGIEKTGKIVFGLGLLATVVLAWYIVSYLMDNQLYIATLYSMIFVVSPMIFFTIKIWTAYSKKNFHRLSSILKWIIFFGILSIIVINLNIRYHA